MGLLRFEQKSGFTREESDVFSDELMHAPTTNADDISKAGTQSLLKERDHQKSDSGP